MQDHGTWMVSLSVAWLFAVFGSLTPAGTLTYSLTAADRVVFDGTVGQHAVHMDTRLVDHTKFLLLSRGFHWVQEFPFNR